jgi:hypothetical protein
MLHKQWLTLNDDQTFNCTSSFFWRNDSLKFLPLIGHWDVDEYYINPSHGETRNEITFKVDSIQKTWDIFGETTTSMYWYNDLGYFHWQIVK